MQLPYFTRWPLPRQRLSLARVYWFFNSDILHRTVNLPKAIMAN
jgi:hypothetical protein